MSRQTDRQESRLNEKLKRMEANGFTYTIRHTTAHVARSKYMPHIGKKQREKGSRA